ncbi:MAG: HipA domain-containing protein [Chlorobi bacterium]|nr:HipA domain-containing protein [Chlorobiota bacterium]
MRCLICYKPLEDSAENYHAECLKKEFDINEMPAIDIDDAKLKSYAINLIEANVAVTGVQPKLSLWLEKSKKNIRFTIVDRKSNFIIKPQSEAYESLPENEDLCMRLASAFGLQTAKHSLVKLPSGNLAYITQRFDRFEEEKLACEDLCQLSETLTEHKYRGSYEKAGKTIRKFSAQPGLDALSFFEAILFNFIIGNADMHLKNFSMIENKSGSFVLSPYYDLLSVFLAIENETEQTALTVNGKKNKLTGNDFDALAENLSLNKKQTENVYEKFLAKNENAERLIENSFLPETQKEKLFELMKVRIETLKN